MDLLSAKASCIQQYVEDYMVDDNHVLYSSIHSDTRKPWTAQDLKPEDDFMPVDNFDTWEVFNYENSGMVTGAYLAAQSCRHRVMSDPESLFLAKRAFEGLRWIYELGQTREEGYFPKPYGGRISQEISTDQYLYAIKGMMAYRDIAPSQDIPKISRMVTTMVDFWIKRNYRHDYFTIKNMLWPLGRFPSLLMAAYAVSADEGYRIEAQRLNQKHRLYLQPADATVLLRSRHKSPFEPFEEHMGNRYLGFNVVECSAMDIMELDECLKYSNEYTNDWLNSMRLSWKEGVLTLTEQGYSRQWLLYDPATGETASPEPQSSGAPEQLNWSYMQWLSGVMSARSTMLARVGMHVHYWLPEENTADIAIWILSKVDRDCMLHNIDPDGKQLLPQHQYLTKLVDADAMVNWLWAYWLGRLQGVIR